MVTGAVVLAGGRSSRMGAPKAALEWHGSTLLRRTVGILARATGGPVVVVRASGQDLPELPVPVTVVDDPREGMGPVQGIAAGLAALAGQAEAAFVASTDLPFLHPAFVRRVLRALDAGGGDPPDREPPGSDPPGSDPPGRPDVALPVARGYPQPLAAAYRTGLAALAERLVARGRLRPAFLFAECAVTRLGDAELLADPVLAALDPGLDSVLNVNTPEDYDQARRRPAPEVTVQLLGALVTPGRPAGPRPARAATLQAAAALNGRQVASDPQAPLARGDTVFFMPADSPAELPAGLPAGPAPGRGRAVAGDKAGGPALGDPQAAAGAMDHPICPVVT